MKYENETFTGSSVDLDGNEFIGCSFEKCTIVYSGGKPPLIGRCTFSDQRFEFRGAAANTVEFLKAMTAPDSGMKDLVRHTFPELYAH